MTVKQVPFAEVFDSTVSFAPKAIVRLPFEEIIDRRHLQVTSSEDGLDAFMAVPMALDLDNGHAVKFALWRHRGNPDGTFAIHFGLPEINVPGLLDAVLRDLEIPDGAVIWRAPEAALSSATTVFETPNVVEGVNLLHRTPDRFEVVHDTPRKKETIPSLPRNSSVKRVKHKQHPRVIS